MKEKFNNLKLKAKNLINYIKKTVSNEIIICDSLFLFGLFIIVITNFLVNKIFGAYFLGITLIAFSMFLNKTKRK